MFAICFSKHGLLFCWFYELIHSTFVLFCVNVFRLPVNELSEERKMRRSSLLCIALDRWSKRVAQKKKAQSETNTKSDRERKRVKERERAKIGSFLLLFSYFPNLCWLSELYNSSSDACFGIAFERIEPNKCVLKRINVCVL